MTTLDTQKTQKPASGRGRGRPCLGARPMTNAERQAAYRERLQHKKLGLTPPAPQTLSAVPVTRARGRPPINGKPMTNAERQAGYRLRKKAKTASPMTRNTMASMSADEQIAQAKLEAQKFDDI